MSNIDKQALTDEAISKAFAGTNFGRDDFKNILAETVIDAAAGWRCGYTATTICTQLGLLTPKGCASALGLRFISEHVQRETKRLKDELEAKEKRIAELESDNAYIRNRHKELDLLIGKNILVMQAAIIEWQGTADARKGLAWIYNTLFGPGELPDEAEKDAQAYFDRKYVPLDEELMNLHRWFWEQSEAERAAAAGKGE
ncbi:ead/Ea22-like family protein [Enterobacter hormaechei]|nr:ead/Ea22-like family protein [Enterobacter hormaechei]EGQ5313063.1 ead/Ea22-like family protein [Enterobacter hormaechei]EGQ5323270.1 ead/Ea22-like family protein [Enterobacter hormaechei]EKT5039862.1 ead/Ea22-like family protein [Enterobacter hormaechei]EKV8268514.1 ead/Ea22-like family protein [Enterobacter hormaechei]